VRQRDTKERGNKKQERELVNSGRKGGKEGEKQMESRQK
jgi:hypothetical protein